MMYNIYIYIYIIVYIYIYTYCYCLHMSMHVIMALPGLPLPGSSGGACFPGAPPCFEKSPP